MTDELIEQNKEALLQEMGTSINEAVGAIQAVISTPSEDAADKMEILYSSMMMISQNLGYLAACFNQYMIFINGVLPGGDEKLIGFNAMVDTLKDGKEK